MKKFIECFQNQLITLAILFGMYAAVIIARQEIYYKSCTNCSPTGSTDTALICIAAAMLFLILWACLPRGPKSSQQR